MSIIAKLKAVLTLDNKAFENGLNESKGAVRGFGSVVGKIGGVIAGAFAVSQITAFGKELVLLNEKASGVQKAFAAIADDGYLESLQKATGNAVSDLELMQKAVQASQFGIGQSSLVKGLQLATIAAAETGQSIDYLVDSFVTGVGRKSLPILDNLNISMLQMQKEIEKTGDFTTALGNIIDKRLGNATLTTEEAAKATDQLATSWDNLKLAMSQFVNSPAVQNAIKFATEILKDITPDYGGKVKVNSATGALDPDSIRLATNKNINDALTRQRDKYQSVFKQIRLNYDGEEEKLTYLKDQLKTVSTGIKLLEAELNVRKHITAETKKSGDGSPYGSIYSSGTTDIGSKTADVNAGFESTAMIMSQMGLEASMAAINFANLGYAMEGVLTKSKEMVDVSGFVVAGISEVGVAIGSIAGGGSAEDALSSFIDGIAGLLQQFGTLLIAWGIGKISLEKLSGPAAIAAGVALVAIGSAISTNNQAVSSYASSGSGGFTGSGGSFNVGSYDYNREVVLIARGPDLVAVMNNQTNKDGLYG